MEDLHTVMTVLLVRFGVIAAGIGVLAVVLFAIALRLKRAGRWEETSRKWRPAVARALDSYADRRSGVSASACKAAARRVADIRTGDEERR